MFGPRTEDSSSTVNRNATAEPQPLKQPPQQQQQQPQQQQQQQQLHPNLQPKQVSGKRQPTVRVRGAPVHRAQIPNQAAASREHVSAPKSRRGGSATTQRAHRSSPSLVTTRQQVHVKQNQPGSLGRATPHHQTSAPTGLSFKTGVQAPTSSSFGGEGTDSQTQRVVVQQAEQSLSHEMVQQTAPQCMTQEIEVINMHATVPEMVVKAVDGLEVTLGSFRSSCMIEQAELVELETAIAEEERSNRIDTPSPQTCLSIESEHSPGRAVATTPVATKIKCYVSDSFHCFTATAAEETILLIPFLLEDVCVVHV